MSPFKDQFVTMRNHKGFVTVASGMEIPVRGIGTVHIDFRTSSGKLVAATINDVLFVPELKAGNLLSESKLERIGFSIISKDGQRRVMQDGKEFIFACLDMDNQFIVQESKYKASFVSYMEAHQCFGHPGDSAMQHLRQRYNKLIPHKPEKFHCPSCILSKSVHHTEKSTHKRTSKPFELIYSDLSGKFSVDSLGGKRYYITFIDDYSRYAWIYLLRNKNDAYQVIHDFVVYIKNQFNVTINTLFSDNGA